MATQTKFQRGDRVIDRSGFRGAVSNVTVWEGSVWYDVRFERGTSVRYDEDLALIEAEAA